jgi:surface antigen
MGVTAAQASQTDCLSYGYACTPGYDAVNTEGTWAWSHYGGSYALNANGYHNCTLYAAWRLEQNGMADPGNWGNAVDWINHTSHNNTPAAGSIAWWGSEAGGGFGHVAYVDQVNGNQVHVMADNYVGPNSDGYTSAGWIPASSVDAFLHPHDLPSTGPSDLLRSGSFEGSAAGWGRRCRRG